MDTGFPVVMTTPTHVLTVRRSLAGQTEVARALAELLPTVADAVDGPPMALRMGYPREDGKAEFDLCFPIREPMDRDGFVTKTLPGLPVFSILHEGALKDGPEGTNLADTWQGFVQFVRDRSILVGDDPTRFIYREGLDTVGSDDEHVRLEVQYAYHLPIWLEAFRAGIADGIDADAAARVLEGSDGLAEAFDGQRAAEWVQGAVERLDREIDDEATRAGILNPCAHHYIVESGERMKALWDEAGHDLHQLMDKLEADPYFGATYWLDASGTSPKVFVKRRPARMEAYENATDPVEKRYHACFCPLVREAIREQKPVSRTFCHCSGGWFVQEWEIVFGQKPEVELVETMLDGADACVFAVRVPEGVLQFAD